jgi:hypothetical protein
MSTKEPTLCPCCHEALACRKCRKPLDADKLLLTCSKCYSPLDVNLSTDKLSVWLMYRGHGMSQDEIKKHFDVSQGRISQICNELETQLPLLKGLPEAYSKADAYNQFKSIKNPFGKSYVKKHTKMTKRSDDSDYIHAKSSRELDKLTTEFLKNTDKILAKTTENENYFRDIELESKVSKKKPKK